MSITNITAMIQSVHTRQTWPIVLIPVSIQTILRAMEVSRLLQPDLLLTQAVIIIWAETPALLAVLE